MTKFLRDLLDAEEPIFSDAVRQLEYLTGKQSADVKLIADITEKAHENLRTLGLDIATATGEEIYFALQGRVEQDINRLAKVIGADDPDDVAHAVPFMIDAANKVKFNRRVFVLKHESAKNLLRKMPPKQLMERLGYSDVEALFEGEDFDEIYTALRFSEGPEWLNKYNELFETITADDYETRDLRILQMDHNKYVDLAEGFTKKKLHNVTHSKEMGTIVVVPMKVRRMRGLLLKTLPLLFHYMNEVQLYSTFFKLKSKKAHFGKIVVNTLIADPGTASQVAGKKIHWRVIQRYLAKHKEEGADKIAFEPHVHPEDLHWRRAEELLYELDPELEFWKDRDYVGLMFDGFPVAFNLFDVSFGYSNKESYEGRYAYHFRESLWNEIFARYMGFKNLREQVLEQLDNDAIAPETLTVPNKQEAPKQAVATPGFQARKDHIAAVESRVKGVLEEFDSVFDVLGKYEKTVTFFGSARESVGDDVLIDVYNLAKKFAGEGYAVITGGGHGVMAAANKGAYEAGGDSIGLNILLPKEQTLNSYTTEHYQFDHFFGRKVSMTVAASGYIYAPGGFGTLDELFEILVLKQTKRIPPIPVILLGSKFWGEMDDFIKKSLLSSDTIDAIDRQLYEIIDDHSTIIRRINAYQKQRLNYSPIEP